MSVTGKLKQILQELKVHSPFTLLGAGTGIVLMLLGQRFLGGREHTLFSIFHPLHVVLSAMVTAALFEKHRKIKNFMVILLIGIVGSIGIATLSDSILPFFGETILGVAVPTHADLHHHEHEADESISEVPHEDAHEQGEAALHEPDHEHDETCDHAIAGEHESHRPRLHLGFIEEWYLVFPSAILGVVLAYFLPATKLPHASHVLVSTWASSAHILMNTQADMSAMLLGGILIVLFLSVWLPCCVSDIVFPLLFTGGNGTHVDHSCILCRKKDKHTARAS